MIFLSRVKSSLKNFKYALFGQLLGVIVSFVARIFFIRILGNEYLGINGLFTNILTILSLAELGVGTAITYSLYKPLAENDIIKCKMLMQLYKKIYTFIGIIILILGLSIMPFLPMLIKDTINVKSINLIYILFVINTAVSYFFSYKRNLIIADQNRYIATIYRYGVYFVLNVVQIIYLITNKNYIGFLLIQIIFTILENVFISIKANKMYPYLKENDKIPLDKTTKDDIIKNTKAMMMHKIGGVVITSTDNIILSSFVGIISVGLYSNYFMISSALSTITSQIFSSLTASVGNLCASSDKDKQYNIFKKINFMSFWIFCFITVCLITLYNPLIEIWIGSQYLFSMDIVIVLGAIFYITGMRKPGMVFREATGLFYRDRWKAIVESILNLGISVVLAIKIGTLGVFLGTLISSMLTSVWVEPYILYKYGFKEQFRVYVIDYIKQILLTVILASSVYILSTFIQGNPFFKFAIKLVLCAVIPNVVMFLIYRKTDEFAYFKNKIIKNLKRIRK